MGGREQRLEAKAKDGLASAESALSSAADKTKEGANALAIKAQELSKDIKTQVEKVHK